MIAKKMTLEYSDTILPYKEEFQMTVKGSTQGKDGPLVSLHAHNRAYS